IRGRTVTGVQTCALPILRSEQRGQVREGRTMKGERAMSDLAALFGPHSRMNRRTMLKGTALLGGAALLDACSKGNSPNLTGPGEIGRASCREEGQRTVAT